MVVGATASPFGVGVVDTSAGTAVPLSAAVVVEEPFWILATATCPGSVLRCAFALLAPSCARADAAKPTISAAYEAPLTSAATRRWVDRSRGRSRAVILGLTAVYISRLSHLAPGTRT